MTIKFITRNPVLIDLEGQRRVNHSNTADAPEGLHSGIGETEGQLLGDLVLNNGAKTVLEVGMANGFSTLYLLDALQQTQGESLVSLDPYQQSDWGNRGLTRVAEAGFAELHEFHSLNSLEAFTGPCQERKFDLIFIDGSHAFDNAFVDFYLSERHLNPGGILVFDDVGWAGVERVCHYIVTNRNYEIIASLSGERTQNAVRPRSISTLKRLGERLARTHRTPLTRHQQGIDTVNSSEMIAFRTREGNTFEANFNPF